METYKITVPRRVVDHFEGTQAWADLESLGETEATEPNTAAAFLRIMDGTLRPKGAIQATFTRDQLDSLRDYVDMMRVASIGNDAYDLRAATMFLKRVDDILNPDGD